MTHNLKLENDFCDYVLEGIKTFELRKNDRNYHPGDIIKFQAVCNGEPVDHKINGKPYKITMVLSGWGLQDGFVAMAIREVESKDGDENGR